MVRILFSSIMVLHALVHLMGFSTEWSLGPKSMLTGKTLIEVSGTTAKIAGLFWLITCVMLLGAAALYGMHREVFWIPAIAGVVISQALIIIYWQDAKYGTVVNAIILIVVIVSAAAIQFNGMVDRDVKTLTGMAGTNRRLAVTEDNIKRLPPTVQQWLRQSNILGKETGNVIHITQKGQMLNEPGGKWMPFEAAQHFTIDPPAFVWRAIVKVNPFMEIAARDKYESGKGTMLIKPFYIYPLANSSGNEIDQGSLLRYLAEITWFPQAAVSDYLTWEEIDNHRARVTMRYKDVTASGIYTFHNNGSVAGFEAQRYGEFDGEYRKETWSIAVTAYKEFNGINIGNVCEVTWKLKEGDFTWLKLEVIEVE
jgi:hypothetical protein